MVRIEGSDATPGALSRTAGFVVPCFNEADRWREDYWADMVSIPATHWLFVDDGSSDPTFDRISAFSEAHRSCRVLRLPRNRGKAEAVRQGMTETIAQFRENASVVGFVDADGAFDRSDVESIRDLAVSKFADGSTDAVWSSRVLLKGRSIDRRRSRHYIARSVSTLLEVVYPGLPYDTQSGYKLFRVCPTLEDCLAQPFETRWMFEIEILLRWEAAAGVPLRIWEEPVMAWRDVAGSKVAGRELARIGRELATLLAVSRQSRRATSGSNPPGQGSGRRA